MLCVVEVSVAFPASGFIVRVLPSKQKTKNKDTSEALR